MPVLMFSIGPVSGWVEDDVVRGLILILLFGQENGANQTTDFPHVWNILLVLRGFFIP